MIDDTGDIILSLNNTKKNVLLNIAYQVVILIIPLILTPYLSRILGADGIGTYAYTNSIAHYFWLFAMLGLTKYGNRAIAQSRDEKNTLDTVFSEIYSLQVVWSLLITIIYISFTMFVVRDYKEIFVIQGIYVFSATFNIIWFFNGIENFARVIFRNVLFRAIMIIGIFVFVKSEDDLWIYTIVMAAGTFASQIVLLVGIGKNVSFVKPTLTRIKKHIIPNIALFIPVIAVSLYRYMDKVMLGMMSSMNEVGMYENADKIVTVPLTVITSIGIVMLPKMSNLHVKGDTKKTFLITKDTLHIVFFLGCGMMFGLVAIANKFVPIYFGEGFDLCNVLIVLLSPIIMIASIGNVMRTQYLIPQNHDKTYILSVMVGAMINLCINCILIKPLGAIGASIGSICAEFSVVIVQGLYLRKIVEIKPLIKNLWVYIVSGICMCVIVKSLDNILSESIIYLCLEILVGVIIHVMCSMVLLYRVDKKEFEHLKHIIGLKRRKK